MGSPFEPLMLLLQGPVHAAMPFPDPKKPQTDMAASQALQPVPGMLAASRALSGTIHMPKQALPATVPEEQEGTDPGTPSSAGVPPCQQHGLSVALFIVRHVAY